MACSSFVAWHPAEISDGITWPDSADADFWLRRIFDRTNIIGEIWPYSDPPTLDEINSVWSTGFNQIVAVTRYVVNSLVEYAGGPGTLLINLPPYVDPDDYLQAENLTRWPEEDYYDLLKRKIDETRAFLMLSPFSWTIPYVGPGAAPRRMPGQHRVSFIELEEFRRAVLEDVPLYEGVFPIKVTHQKTSLVPNFLTTTNIGSRIANVFAASDPDFQKEGRRWCWAMATGGGNRLLIERPALSSSIIYENGRTIVAFKVPDVPSNCTISSMVLNVFARRLVADDMTIKIFIPSVDPSKLGLADLTGADGPQRRVIPGSRPGPLTVIPGGATMNFVNSQVAAATFNAPANATLAGEINPIGRMTPTIGDLGDSSLLAGWATTHHDLTSPRTITDSFYAVGGHDVVRIGENYIAWVLLMGQNDEADNGIWAVSLDLGFPYTLQWTKLVGLGGLSEGFHSVSAGDGAHFLIWNKLGHPANGQMYILTSGAPSCSSSSSSCSGASAESDNSLSSFCANCVFRPLTDYEANYLDIWNTPLTGIEVASFENSDIGPSVGDENTFDLTLNNLPDWVKPGARFWFMLANSKELESDDPGFPAPPTLTLTKVYSVVSAPNYVELVF